MALQAGETNLAVANELVALAIGLEEKANLIEEVAKVPPAAQSHQPAAQTQEPILPKDGDE